MCFCASITLALLRLPTFPSVFTNTYSFIFYIYQYMLLFFFKIHLLCLTFLLVIRLSLLIVSHRLLTQMSYKHKFYSLEIKFYLKSTFDNNYNIEWCLCNEMQCNLNNFLWKFKH